MLRTFSVLMVLCWLLNPVQGAANEPEPRLMLVLPIQGSAPPGLHLPSVAEMVEFLLLELPPGSLKVVAEEKLTGAQAGDQAERARARAQDLGAQAAIFGEILEPGTCRAAKLVRIHILEVRTGHLLDRDLCPEGTGKEALARAIALTTSQALRSGLIDGITIIDQRLPKEPPSGEGIPPAPGECPKDQPPVSCPSCPECRCLPCPVGPEPSAPRLFVAVGGIFTSHPDWHSPGYGFVGEFSWAPLSFIEVGIGLSAVRAHVVEVSGVSALYSNWPLSLFGRVRIGTQEFEALGGIGFVLAFTRFSALITPLSETKSFDRADPAVFARLGLRWWSPWHIGLQFEAGPTLFLLRQRYTYAYYGQTQVVLSMDIVALDATLSIVVPFL